LVDYFNSLFLSCFLFSQGAPSDADIISSLNFFVPFCLGHKIISEDNIDKQIELRNAVIQQAASASAVGAMEDV
jgi:hypothetical protein